MNQVLQVMSKIQTNLGREIDYLRTRVERVEKQAATNSLSIKRYADQVDGQAKKIKLLDERTNELSRFTIKEEEKIPYVFTAPLRNRYFAGREKEIEELKRILKIDETSNEKNVRVAAVYGLGGIGKTSLVSEYAHQMKDFYMGGVYWFSAEDDTFLERTVNNIALKLRALLGSFDLTLSNTLKKIGTTHDPSLIVLDCLDQLELSSKMMNVLSFPSRENIFGHFILVTRRNPNRLVNEVSVIEHDSCSNQNVSRHKKQSNFFSQGLVLIQTKIVRVSQKVFAKSWGDCHLPWNKRELVSKYFVAACPYTWSNIKLNACNC